MSFSDLNVEQLGLGLEQLWSTPADEHQAKARGVLEQSHSAKIYLPILKTLAAQVERVVAAEELPLLTAQLVSLSERHDSQRRALHYLCSGLEEGLPADDPRQGDARAVHLAFGSPTLDGYDLEASLAEGYRAALGRLEPELTRLGPDFQRFALGMTEAAENLRPILAQRDGLAESALPVRRLRFEVLRALTAFRAAFKEELAVRPELPRNGEGLVFGAFDAMSARNATSPKAPTPAA